MKLEVISKKENCNIRFEKYRYGQYVINISYINDKVDGLRAVGNIDSPEIKYMNNDLYMVFDYITTKDVDRLKQNIMEAEYLMELIKKELL